MNKHFFGISGTPASVLLKEVDLTGALVGGGLSVTGTLVSTGIYSFDVSYTRYYTLYTGTLGAETPVSTASIMLLLGGTSQWTSNGSGEAKAVGNVDMNSYKLTGLAAGTSDNDSVRYVQVKNAVTGTLYSSTPTVAITIDNTIQAVRMAASNYSTVPMNTTYIFFYSIESTATVPTYTIDSNGNVTGGSDLVSVTSNIPKCIFPKNVRMINGKYLHGGIALINFSTKSSVITASPVLVGSTDAMADASLWGALAGNPSTACVVVDNGDSIIITIPTSDVPTHIGFYEFAVCYLPTGSADPVITTSNISAMTNYVIYRSATRSIQIPKLYLPAGSEYNVWVTYRYVNIVNSSNWYVTSTKPVKKAILKAPSKWTAEEIDALLDRFCNTLVADSGGNITRK